jgi:hypothetical protein
MAGTKYLGTLAVKNTGADPITVNLAQFPIPVKDGIPDIPANPAGPIPAEAGSSPPTKVTRGGTRSLWISIDNKPGTDLVYLAPPRLFPEYDYTPPDPPPASPTYEIRSLTGQSVFGGTRDDIGPIDYNSLSEVLRALPGADAMVTVRYRGQGFS